MKTYLALLLLAVNATVGMTESLAQNQVAAWGNNDSGQLLLPNGLNNVKQIAAGTSHSLALRSDGTVVGWGNNAFGATVPPSGLSNVLAVAAGSQHSLALRANGTVAAWGNNASGQTNVPSSLSNVVQISSGSIHSLALKIDGTVVAWGGGSNGEGHVPPGLSNVKAVVAGVGTSLALKRDGTVVAWGSTANGSVPNNLSDVVALASGAKQNLALKADGTIVAWGSGYAGQTNPPPGLSNVVAVSAGTYQSLALKADGSLVAWGTNIYSLTNIPNGLSNVTAIAAGGSHNLAIVPNGPPEIIAGPFNLSVPYQNNFVLTVTTRGGEPLSYRWIFNGFSLSDSSRISGSHSASLTISNAQFADAGSYRVVVSNALGAVQSTDAIVTVFSAPIFLQQPASREVRAGTNVVLAATVIGSQPISYRWKLNGVGITGATQSTLILANVQSTNAGTYTLLAGNTYGLTESSNAVLSVTQSVPYILTQPANRSATVGGNATFLVTARGSDPLFYQWQREGKNILGATNVTLNLAGLQFADEGFYSVVVSNSVGVTVSAKAFLSVSQLAVWGTQVPSALTNFPSGLSNVVALAAGESHVLALKTDGTVAAWGSRKTTTSSNWSSITIETNNPAANVPTGLENVVAISAGEFHSLALKSDGTVVAWGDNLYGQTNVPPSLSNVIAIAAGGNNSMALRADTSIVVWGGERNSPIIYSTPLTNVPPGLSNLTAIAAGLSHGMALKNDGRVVTWGAGTNAPAGLSNVIAIAFGKVISGIWKLPYSSSPDDYLALRSDGAVVSWSDRYLTLPTGFSVVSGLSNVVEIAGGPSSILALSSDGSVSFSHSANQPPQNLTNVVAIAAGGSASASIRSPFYPPLQLGAGFYVAAVGNGSPVFRIQPARQQAVRGGQIQLHARGVGVPPLRFRWQFNGTNIPGATNGTLTISNFQPENIGEYRAIASNALGVATSKVANVWLPAPSIPLAVNASSLPWTASSSTTDGNWFPQLIETHDGDAAAQSGPISHGQFSQLQTTVNGPGTISFWWKTSSEQGYDFLQFFVGETNVPLAILSGETGWQQQTFSVPAGSQNLKWIYSKDESVSTGADAGWLDEVSIAPAPVSVAPQFSVPQILEDGSFAVSIASANAENILWNGLELQTSSNLVDWFSLTNGECSMALTNGNWRMRDGSNTNCPVRFYRFIHR